MKKRIHLLPHVVTACGLACGLLLIFKTNLVAAGENSEKFLRISTLLLAIAAFADLMDGLVARLIHAESPFGIVFDSLSDAITFGVAPSVLMLKSLSFPAGSALSFLTTLAAMIYSICGVLRLVRFSIKMQKPSQQNIRAYFKGLPIPVGAGAAVSINFLLLSDSFQARWPLNEWGRALILIFAMIFIGYLMVSSWQFPSLQALRFCMAGSAIGLVSLGLAVIFVYGLLYHFELFFFIFCWSYLVGGFMLSLLRLAIRKRKEWLKSFDLESSET